MNEAELLRKALDMGFANAALIGTGDITFVPAFRPLCRENLCGQYGANYACPPACGSVEEMRARILRHPRALVMQTMWDIEDPLDAAQTRPAKGRHNQLTRRLIDWAGEPGLMVGASGCSLCSPCAVTGGGIPAVSRSCNTPVCPPTACLFGSWRRDAAWSMTAARAWSPFSVCIVSERTGRHRRDPGVRAADGRERGFRINEGSPLQRQRLPGGPGPCAFADGHSESFCEADAVQARHPWRTKGGMCRWGR